LDVNVVITTYNYAQHLTEAIDSVLRQTYNNIAKIIVIDDGSNDGTIELFNEKYGGLEKVILIKKENGGQLSALNFSLNYINDCDVVFFLDPDDVYCENYIERSVQHFQKHEDCDFLFYKRQYFGLKNHIESPYGSDRAFSFTQLRTFYLKKYFGSATSLTSMRYSILKKILPIPFEDEWKLRADDCLTWGASLVGAKKYYIDEPLVKYRVHKKNYHYGKKFSSDYLQKRERSIEKLFKYILDRNGINIDARKLLFSEFTSIQNKTLKDVLQFFRILLRVRMPITDRATYICFFLRAYIKGKVQLYLN